jgi:plastocyanin
VSLAARAAWLAALALPGLAAAATHAVTIEGMRFQPESVTVKPGDTVTWNNKDLVPHTVTAPGHFDSKAIDAGKSWSWTAKGKGRQDYVCTFHLGMKGSVVVE